MLSFHLAPLFYAPLFVELSYIPTMKYLVLVSFVLFGWQTVNAQRLSTVFTKDLSRWTFSDWDFRTTFNNDWDQWDCDGTRIRTEFANDWDSWKIGNVTMRTVFFNDFDRWEIKGNGQTVTVRTTFNDDYERWEVDGDGDGTIRTVFSGDFEKWQIEGDFDNLDDDMMKAIVFVAIFASFQLEH